MDENLNNLGIGNLAEYFNTTTVKMVIITPEAKTPKRIALDCLPEDSKLSAERNNTDSKTSLNTTKNDNAAKPQRLPRCTAFFTNPLTYSFHLLTSVLLWSQKPT